MVKPGDITPDLVSKLLQQYPNVNVQAMAEVVEKTPWARSKAALLTHRVKVAFGLKEMVRAAATALEMPSDTKQIRRETDDLGF